MSVSAKEDYVAVRRSSIDIIAEIMRLGGANKTRVMYQVNMSHAQMQFYLAFLTERGLLEARRGSRGIKVYTPTPRGLTLLDHIEKVQDMVGALDGEL